MSRVLLRAAVSAVLLSAASDARKVKPDGSALLSTARTLDSRSRLKEQATATADDAVNEAEAELAKEMPPAEPEAVVAFGSEKIFRGRSAALPEARDSQDDKKNEKVVKRKVALADQDFVQDGDDKEKAAEEDEKAVKTNVVQAADEDLVKDGDDKESVAEEETPEEADEEEDGTDDKAGKKAAKKDETKKTTTKDSKKEATKVAKKDDKQKENTKAPEKDDEKKDTAKAAKKEEKKEEAAKVSKEDDKKKETPKAANKDDKQKESKPVAKSKTDEVEKPSMPNIGNPKCPCVGFAGTKGNLTVSLGNNKTVPYAAEAFASCDAWDDDSHPACKMGGDGTAWCEEPWCVVDPCNCEIDIAPKKATGGYFPDGDFQGMGAYWYSYATCGGKDVWADEATQKKTMDEPKECDKKVEEKKWGDSECQCIGVAGRQGNVEVEISGNVTASYPMDAGATCKAWDLKNHPQCQGKEPADWCKQVWCYVDPCSCAIAVSPKVSNYMKDASWLGRPVYYSYNTCGGNDTYTESHEDACVNQKSEEKCGKQSACAWDGQQCLGKELVKVCKKTTKKQKTGTEAETQNKTDEKAQAKKQPMAKFGTPKCPCVGLDGVNGELTVSLGGNKTASYPADAFASCAAWDANSHPKCARVEDGDSWCHQAWCVVDPCNCELDIAPKRAPGGYWPDGDFQGMGAYWYSYATCGAKDVWADEATQKKMTDEPKECDKKVDETKWGDMACQCIGVAGRPGNVDVRITENNSVSYPMDAGATCKAWDMKNHPDCLGEDAADWCKQVWCYVDPCSCAIPVSPKVSNYMKDATYSGRPVYYSYNTCGGNDTYTDSQENACVNQQSEEECGNQSACAWDGKQCLGKELVKVCKEAVESVEKEERTAAKKGAEDTHKSGALLPAAPFLAAFLAFVAVSS